MSLNWDLSDVFPMMALGLYVFGRNTTEVECHCHHILSKARITSMTSLLMLRTASTRRGDCKGVSIQSASSRPILLFTLFNAGDPCERCILIIARLQVMTLMLGGVEHFPRPACKRQMQAEDSGWSAVKTHFPSTTPFCLPCNWAGSAVPLGREIDLHRITGVV